MVKITDIAKEISKALEDYTDDVKAEMKEAQDDLSKEGVNLLKDSSPKNQGDYASSWTRKKTKEGYTIHNKEHYRLTHLLENGHAKRNGGRVPAQIHIKPVEERLVDEFEKRVERAIKP